MEARDRILQAAEELFFKYGIRSVTMDDIAKHLLISKKTIYMYFRDKNEMVDTLMIMKLKQDENELKQIQATSENVIVEVFGMMRHMGDMFSKVNPNIFYDLQKYHPGVWERFKVFKEECMAKMIEESIERGVREGFVRADLNSKILARLRMEEVEMGLDATLFPPDKFKMLEVQLALIDHFLHGICTLKGHKLVNRYKHITEEE